jgi:hypothetical protein
MVPAVLFMIMQAPPPAAQNPSPMVEHTRKHERVPQTQPPGRRAKLSIASLFLSAGSEHKKAVPLVVHFHGPDWLAESAAVKWKKRVCVVTVQLGAGSGVYSQAFAEPSRFAALVKEAEEAAGLTLKPVVISSFSAGYGAVREILKNRENWKRVDGIILEDSLHTSYIPEGRPGPLDTARLEPFVAFVREAVAGRKRMLVTNSEVFPGTFASTTETTDSLAEQLGLQRRPILRWGPNGMQQVSEIHRGRFHLFGFAGNSAPDHTDHLQGLAEWLKRL